jgi:hypothetical protein
VRIRGQRVALVTGMVLANLNVWTGAPLLGLWLGSRVTGGTQITMFSVLVIVVTMFAACLGMVRVLAALSRRHDKLTGRQATVRRHTPWLRSMSGERPHDAPTATAQLTAVEYTAVAMVVLVVVLFEIWFFFFASSPIDQRSGRN